MRPRWAWAALAVLALAACGDDGGDEEDGGTVPSVDSTAESGPSDALGEDPTFESCADAYADLLSNLDITGLPTDGVLDDAQRADLEARLSTLLATEPALDEGGACEPVMEAATDEQIADLVARIPPDVAAVLGMSAQVQFEEVEGEL